MVNEELIKYSLKHIWKSKARSFLTILSVLIGIATIFIFVSFGLGLYNYTQELSQGSSVDKVIIQARGNAAPGLDDTFKLTDDDLEEIEKTRGVLEASGSYFKVAEIEQNGLKKYTFIASYDPEVPIMFDTYDVGIEKGSWLGKGDTGKVLLGYNYLVEDKIFPEAYSLNDKIEVQGQKLRIVGFLESIGSPPDDAQIYVINDFIDELYPNEENSYGMIVARVELKEIDETTKRIKENLRKSRGLKEGKEDFYVQSFQDLIDSFSVVLNGIIGFVVLIALISVLVSAINTSNTMITSVLERTKEIGVMKAIGAKNDEILKIFLFEAAFLGFVAGIIGTFFGFIFSYTAGIILENLGWGFLSPAYPISLFVGCVLFAVLTGAISGAFPAIQASKTNVVDALRYE